MKPEILNLLKSGETVDLSGKEISKEDLPQIAEAIKANPNLTELLLSNNKIIELPSDFISAIYSHPKLTRVDLSKNSKMVSREFVEKEPYKVKEEVQVGTRRRCVDFDGYSAVYDDVPIYETRWVTYEKETKRYKKDVEEFLPEKTAHNVKDTLVLKQQLTAFSETSNQIIQQIKIKIKENASNPVLNKLLDELSTDFAQIAKIRTKENRLPTLSPTQAAFENFHKDLQALKDGKSIKITLTKEPDLIKYLAKIISIPEYNPKGLQSLELQQIDTTNKDLALQASFNKIFKEVEQLILNDVKVTENFAQELTASVSQAKGKLGKIELKNCPFEGAALGKLVSIIKSTPDISLEMNELMSIQSGKFILKEDPQVEKNIGAICETIKSQKQWKEITVPSSALKPVLQALENNQSAITLHLPRELEGTELFKGIKAPVETMQLKDARLYPESVTLLENAITNLSALKKISITNCDWTKLNDTHAAHLVNVINKSSIVEVELQGSPYLSTIFSELKNSQIKKLTVDASKMSDKEFKSLLSFLQTNKTVNALDLRKTSDAVKTKEEEKAYQERLSQLTNTLKENNTTVTTVQLDKEDPTIQALTKRNQNYDQLMKLKKATQTGLREFKSFLAANFSSEPLNVIEKFFNYTRDIKTLDELYFPEMSDLSAARFEAAKTLVNQMLESLKNKNIDKTFLTHIQKIGATFNNEKETDYFQSSLDTAYYFVITNMLKNTAKLPQNEERIAAYRETLEIANQARKEKISKADALVEATYHSLAKDVIDIAAREKTAEANQIALGVLEEITFGKIFLPQNLLNAFIDQYSKLPEKELIKIKDLAKEVYFFIHHDTPWEKSTLTKLLNIAFSAELALIEQSKSNLTELQKYNKSAAIEDIPISSENRKKLSLLYMEMAFQRKNTAAYIKDYELKSYSALDPADQKELFAELSHKLSTYRGEPEEVRQLFRYILAKYLSSADRETKLQVIKDWIAYTIYQIPPEKLYMPKAKHEDMKQEIDAKSIEELLQHIEPTITKNSSFFFDDPFYVSDLKLIKSQLTDLFKIAPQEVVDSKPQKPIVKEEKVEPVSNVNPEIKKPSPTTVKSTKDALIKLGAGKDKIKTMEQPSAIPEPKPVASKEKEQPYSSPNQEKWDSYAKVVGEKVLGEIPVEYIDNISGQIMTVPVLPSLKTEDKNTSPDIYDEITVKKLMDGKIPDPTTRQEITGYTKVRMIKNKIDGFMKEAEDKYNKAIQAISEQAKRPEAKIPSAPPPPTNPNISSNPATLFYHGNNTQEMPMPTAPIEQLVFPAVPKEEPSAKKEASKETERKKVAQP